MRERLTELGVGAGFIIAGAGGWALAQPTPPAVMDLPRVFLAAVSLLSLGVGSLSLILFLMPERARKKIARGMMALGQRIDPAQSIANQVVPLTLPEEPDPDAATKLARYEAADLHRRSIDALKEGMRQGYALVDDLGTLDPEKNDPSRFRTIVGSWIASIEQDVRTYWPGPDADTLERLPRVSPRQQAWNAEEIEAVRLRLGWLRKIAQREVPVDVTTPTKWPWDRDT